MPLFFFRQEIDDCLVQAKDRSYDALVHFGKRGLNVAATAAVMAASKVLCGGRGGGGVSISTVPARPDHLSPM